MSLLSPYLSLLRKWNPSIRLVGDASEGALLHHVEDAQHLLGFIPDGPGRLVDVGAGGGFPSVVIALERPTLHVAALEPIRKKHAFLATVKRELGLQNFHPYPCRDDAHLADPNFMPYEVATSRATFPVLEWMERGRRLVSPGGRVLGLEGRERDELPADVTRHPYVVGGRQHAILVRQL